MAPTSLDDDFTISIGDERDRQQEAELRESHRLNAERVASGLAKMQQVGALTGGRYAVLQACDNRPGRFRQRWQTTSLTALVCFDDVAMAKALAWHLSSQAWNAFEQAGGMEVYHLGALTSPDGFLLVDNQTQLVSTYSGHYEVFLTSLNNYQPQ